MKVLYYYFYLLYKKILDPDPRLAATLGVTALESFFLVQSLGIACAEFFCFGLTKYHMMAITILILLVNTCFFFTNKKINLILKAKPKFFNNHALTIAVILFVSLIVVSSLFWSGHYMNLLIARCH